MSPIPAHHIQNPGAMVVRSTGSTTDRSLADRHADVVNVKDFGARCDGATDDHAALALMVATLGTTPRTVIVPGDCRNGTALVLPATLRVRFEGNGTFSGAGPVTYTPWTDQALSVRQFATGPSTLISGHPSNAIAADVERSIILGGGAVGYNNVIGGDGANVNTVTPNTTQLGTGAHVSVVAGYDNSAGQLSSKIIADHSRTLIGGQGHNAIYGGAMNTITADAAFAGIFAGKETTVSGFYAFATGYLNNVSGQSARASGDHNTVSGNGAGADGTTNTASGLYSYAHGTTNTASGNYSRALGAYAKARTPGQVVLSTNRFAANGDQQTSVLEMGKATTDATTTTLGYVGGNTSHTLEENQSVAFQILVVARVVGGTDTKAWKIEGVARRAGAGSTPVYVAAPTVTVIAGDAGAGAWTVATSAASDGQISVRITGEAGKTIRWVQRMTLVEVIG